MLSTFDLQRVSAERAAAVLVLCDKFSLDPSNKLNTHQSSSKIYLFYFLFSSGGCFEHYAGHFCKELQREHEVHCPAPALSQQGDQFSYPLLSDIIQYFSLTCSIFLAGTGGVTTRQSVSMRLSRILTIVCLYNAPICSPQIRNAGSV